MFINSNRRSKQFPQQVLGLWSPTTVTRVVTLSAIAAFAQTVHAQKLEAEAAPTASVLIKGVANDRRESSVAKQVVTRDDIVRFGDSNLTAVLRRIPGITISESAGNPSEIRMRGLGAGYTQFLVNGEKVASGFSIDSISPELIDRIEVIRSSSADESTQAIAGTLNIILKKSVRPGQSDVKASVSTYRDVFSKNLSGQYGNNAGNMSYSLAGSLKQEKDIWPSITEQNASENGVPLYDRSVIATEQRRETTLSLTPRANWKLDNSRALSIDGLLQAQRSQVGEVENRETSFGPPPRFLSDSLDVDNEAVQARLTEAFKSPVGESGRIEQKVVLDFNRRTADGLRQFFSDQQMNQTALNRQVDSLLKG